MFGFFGGASAAPAEATTPPGGDGANGKGGKSRDDPECKVHCGNLAWKTKWQDLKTHLSKAGTVTFCGVLTEDGTDWGRSRGAGYALFATPAEAQAAVNQLNNSELDGRTITVDKWTGSWKDQGGPPEHLAAKGYGTSKGKGKSKAMMMWNMWAMMGGKGYGKGKGRGKGRPRVDPQFKAWVGNLSTSVTWQELREHMGQAGTVKWTELFTKGAEAGAKSNGTGFVEFASIEEVQKAVATLNGSTLGGQAITVDLWAKPESEPTPA